MKNLFIISSDLTNKFDYPEDYCEVVYLGRTQGIFSSMLRETIYDKK